MTYRPGDICNSILRRSFEQRVPINELHLQKTIYFVASLYQRRTKTPLIADRFEAWQYGPVLRSVYYEFRRFEGQPIDHYFTYAGKSFQAEENNDPELRRALDQIWATARTKTPVDLVHITHLEGSAWSQAWDSYADYLDPELIGKDSTYDHVFLSV